ncbi:MAG: hypothetical protein LAO51_17335, partial [Acidobacteriia bacterium]|nr:hypothetical protein [Terriglobia bacterium]
MGLRILILGRLPDDVRRQVEGLGHGAMVHDLAAGDDPEEALRSLAPDLAILGPPGPLASSLGADGAEALERRIEHEYVRSVRYRHPLAVALLSVDDVAGLARIHGQATVDALADSLVEAARRAIREVDILFRSSR